MKEEESNWFSRWEEELPSPDELMPLSQTLITPDLALAFDIPSPPNSISNYGGSHHHHHHHQTPPLPTPQSQSQSQSQSQQQQSQQVEYDSSDLGGGGGDEQARTLKRPRLVWTPQLHKRFVDAVAHLGIKNAVPKTIMQLMSVDGLTRENVASHLQKYRLYLKRMQGLSSSGGGPGGPVSAADSAMDRLFASAPVPHHFLNRGPTIGPGAEQFTPFASPPGAMQQMMATAAQQQQQYYHHRHIGHLGLPTGSGFDLGYQSRHPRPGFNRTTGPVGIQMAPSPSMGSYAVDLNSGGDGQRVLSLFPANDD